MAKGFRALRSNRAFGDALRSLVGNVARVVGRFDTVAARAFISAILDLLLLLVLNILWHAAASVATPFGSVTVMNLMASIGFNWLQQLIQTR